MGLLQTTALTRRLLAPNPGPMTLDGTNSYLLGTTDGPLIAVDPGPLDEPHLTALSAAGRITLILLTHRHADHTDGAHRLRELTGAPVRAANPAFCHAAPPLEHGEQITIGSSRLTVVATPGHTDDSVCFHLPDDAPTDPPPSHGGGAGSVVSHGGGAGSVVSHGGGAGSVVSHGGGAGSVLTGDTILGRGTTVISPEGGDLADYLASLDLLESLGAAAVLPAHGPQRTHLAEICRTYRTHRLERLDQIRHALTALGHQTGTTTTTSTSTSTTGVATDDLVARVVDLVYADVDQAVRPAATASVAAQVAYLTGERHRA